MPRQCGPTSAGQQAEAIVQARDDLREAERGDAGRREFDRQRYAVETAAKRRDGMEVIAARRKGRMRGRRPLDEQRHRAMARE